MNCSVDLVSHFWVSFPSMKNTSYGKESLCYLGEQIWDLVPKEFKELSSLSSFKKATKCGNLRIALVGYVKNASKTSVFTDPFSDILKFLKPDYFRGNEGRLIHLDSLDDGGEIFSNFILLCMGYFIQLLLLLLVDLN